MKKAAAGFLMLVSLTTLGTVFASSDDPPDVTDAELEATISAIVLPKDEIVMPLPQEVITESVDDGQRVIGLNTDILFEFGEAAVADAGAARIADVLADVPQGAAVLIGGHTDSVGDDASNQVLSQQRADAIAAIVGTARPDLRLTVIGYGESMPIASNTNGAEDNPEGRASNRRVELRVG